MASSEHPFPGRRSWKRLIHWVATLGFVGAGLVVLLDRIRSNEPVRVVVHPQFPPGLRPAAAPFTLPSFQSRIRQWEYHDRKRLHWRQRVIRKDEFFLVQREAGDGDELHAWLPAPTYRAPNGTEVWILSQPERDRFRSQVSSLFGNPLWIFGAGSSEEVDLGGGTSEGGIAGATPPPEGIPWEFHCISDLHPQGARFEVAVVLLADLKLIPAPLRDLNSFPRLPSPSSMPLCVSATVHLCDGEAAVFLQSRTNHGTVTRALAGISWRIQYQ